ncbi:hypothetical protein CTAYLR_008815 [Chrysophaeum taylorii]|uniref:Protein-serine/threonine kinase n=1 Tax=Chrysophaeum taylorii TaxID=2483200 RepID=A0AAD7UPQ1_9STRA|nr:hypothetical protein CTAYLR_008815 [Chrysophaeum taylorii]
MVGQRIIDLASRDVAVLTMETLTKVVANQMRAAPFLQETLPCLMARMALSLDSAPTSLSSLPALGLLRDWYGESAELILACERLPASEWRTRPSRTFCEREEKFAKTLEEIRVKGRQVRESLVAATSATGGLWRRNVTAAVEIDAFLETFYAKRLTLRLLMGQYAACRREWRDDCAPIAAEHSMDSFLRRNDKALESSGTLSGYLRSTFDQLDVNKDGTLDSEELSTARSLYEKIEPLRGLDRKPSVLGLVDMEMSPFDVAVQAVADVQAECRMSEFRRAPPFTMYGRGKGETMPYLPRHLYKILRDVLRNAAKATLEKYEKDEMPAIKVVISDAEGQNDVVIKCADEAGGIPRSKVRTIFSFAQTSATEKEITSVLADQALCRSLGDLEPSKAHPLNMSPAHRVIGTHRVGGHGLPISRLYARYFDGDLRIRSMQGYGTDAYIFISRVAQNVLPT